MKTNNSPPSSVCSDGPTVEVELQNFNNVNHIGNTAAALADEEDILSECDDLHVYDTNVLLQESLIENFDDVEDFSAIDKVSF